MIDFNDLFVIDSSLNAEQQALLRASFEEYAILPTIAAELAELKSRLDNLPEPHNRITIRNAADGHEVIKFDYFDYEAYLKKQSVQTLVINFDQLKSTKSCNLETGEVATVFSPGIILWGHEIAGHAADPILHEVQDRLLASPEMTEIAGKYRLADVADKDKILSDASMIRLRMVENVVNAHEEHETPIIFGDYLEVRAVDITDRVRGELPEPMTLRQYYSNGALKSAEQMIGTFHDKGSLKQSLINSLTKSGTITDNTDGLTLDDLVEKLHTRDCKDMQELITEELQNLPMHKTDYKRGI